MSKNVIFLINIVHNERSKNQGYDYSIKSWKSYADKYNCDLFILDEAIMDISYMAPHWTCLLYTSPSPRDGLLSRMPSSA